MPPAIITVRAPWISAASPATLPSTAQNRASARRAATSCPASAAATISAGSRSVISRNAKGRPADAATPPPSTASICDRPLPHSMRSFDARPKCALSQCAIACSSSPSGAKLTWPPSVSTTCQPRSCDPSNCATPKPVPGPSTLTGPRNGASCSPCRAMKSRGCSAGTAHATAPKSLSSSSSSSPSACCNSRRPNDQARLVRRISSASTGEATAIAARRDCTPTAAR